MPTLVYLSSCCKARTSIYCCSHFCDLSPERPLVDGGISFNFVLRPFAEPRTSFAGERGVRTLAIQVRVSYRFEFEGGIVSMVLFVAVVFFVT